MAEVLFSTSGSTGAAKCIVRTEESLRADARSLVTAFPEIWSSRPPVVSSVRAEHMFGALWCVRAPAAAGAEVVPGPVLSVEELLAAHRRLGAFLFVTTPSFLEKALSHPDFVRLKGAFSALVTSGSPLRRETALKVLETVGVCPLEIYGSTEAGTVAWRRQTEAASFTLVPGVSAVVSESGRLVVDSPFAMVRPLEMGDCAEMCGARQFVLKGRADRHVKILERYVSLSAVESALSAHPLVADVRVEPFGEGVPRLGALVVPTAAGVDLAAREGSSAVAAVLRKALSEKLEKIALPRRFRLVRALPANTQGKTTAAAVRAVLDAWCREPTVLSWRVTEKALLSELAFPEDLECFQGHFPGVPILPGVAQLYFLRHFARQAFPDWPETVTYRKLKFRQLIRPGAHVTLSVERSEEGAYVFSLTGACGICASGVVERGVADA